MNQSLVATVAQILAVIVDIDIADICDRRIMISHFIAGDRAGWCQLASLSRPHVLQVGFARYAAAIVANQEFKQTEFASRQVHASSGASRFSFVAMQGKFPAMNCSILGGALAPHDGPDASRQLEV